MILEFINKNGYFYKHVVIIPNFPKNPTLKHFQICFQTKPDTMIPHQINL